MTSIKTTVNTSRESHQNYTKRYSMQVAVCNRLENRLYFCCLQINHCINGTEKIHLMTPFSSIIYRDTAQPQCWSLSGMCLHSFLFHYIYFNILSYFSVHSVYLLVNFWFCSHYVKSPSIISSQFSHKLCLYSYSLNSTLICFNGI